jgi:cbb3-type cytochrome oxidase maturation protein
MDILYLLIPVSVVVMLGVIGVFAWALQRGQFDDLDREGQRILDGGEENTGLDVDQVDDTSGR